MRQYFSALFAGFLTINLVGCTPPPATNEPDRDQVEVDVRRDASDAPPSEPGVDVQVGGGNGVDVQVDPGRPGANVDIGHDADQ